MAGLRLTADQAERLLEHLNDLLNGLNSDPDGTLEDWRSTIKGIAWTVEDAQGDAAFRRTHPRRRDAQKGKLYRAESLLGEGPALDAPAARRFLAEAFANGSLRRRFPQFDPTTVALAVEPASGKAPRCHYDRRTGTSTLFVPAGRLNPTILLHEVAHAVVKAVYGVDAVGHGGEFAFVFRALVGWVLGPEARRTLLTGYAVAGVDAQPTLPERAVAHPVTPVTTADPILAIVKREVPA